MPIGLTTPALQQLISVARGDEPADLVITGARVFDVFTREWLNLDVAVTDGLIAGLGDYPQAHERIDAHGAYLVPGYIDAHVHIESSKLPPHEFARTVLAHGTTTVVADPHEIANVLGVPGVEWLLNATGDLPLGVFVMAPSCVPASAFESAGAVLSPADISQILEHPRVLGVGEMMNFPGVIAGAASELDKLTTTSAMRADGHAPGVAGNDINAYIAAGIRTDHESTTAAEALAKRRRGMWVLMREASNASNLRTLLPLVREYGPDFCALCTDDREPDQLAGDGQIDYMLRICVEEGIAPEDALVMATLGPARAHGIEDRGAIAPGRRADFQLIANLTDFRPTDVWTCGRRVVQNGEALPIAAAPVPGFVRDSVHIAPIELDDLRIAWPDEAAPARIIVAREDQLVTGVAEEAPLVEDGVAIADPTRDMAKMVVVERHRGTGQIGLGFIRGFGLQRGAFASTVAHDAHNIVAVGTDDASILACIERLAQLGGGIVAARDGEVTGELALPIAGLLADEPTESVVAKLGNLHARLREQGVTAAAPFMMLSFMALSVIPSLKLTDQGLVDVERFSLTPLAVDDELVSARSERG